MASTLKREEPKPPNPSPPRTCIICCDDLPEKVLIRPCRICKSDYCKYCLRDMFDSAICETGRMPPKCCALIQIYTVLEYLGEEQAREYREKFEEWLTPTKTYCPSPKCSVFISDRLLPPTPPPPQSPISPVSPLSSKPPPALLKPMILDVLDRVSASQSARFFRGELPITDLPGFTKVVQRHMDLSIIRGNIDVYRSMSDVTADMNLIVSNAVEYNGKHHPVTEAAHELYYLYNIEVAETMDRMIKSPSVGSSPPPRFFPCPKCHIAICTSCHQIEHGEKPCDHTASDQEMAMLESFGYKRCPRCHAGVKKMYGCSHIHCHCGAHWCYYCQRSTTECIGECDERYDDEDDDEEDEDDYDSELGEMEEDDGIGDAEPTVEVGPAPAAPPPATARTSNATLTLPPRPVPAPAQHNHRVVNLDAGGGNRWAESEYDFGDEPEEESGYDIWCCVHKFESFVAPPEDGFNRGNLDRMECNRCFDKVVGKKASQPVQPPHPKAPAQKKRSKKLDSQKDNDVVMKDEPPTKQAQEVKEKEAIECSRCRVLVCPACRDKYLEESASSASG